MRLLDLFSGAGGAAAGYHRAGFEVVGVDIVPQPRFPFEFIQADALSFDARGFDAIHASPPCQRHSQNNNWRRGALTGTYVDLIGATRAMLERIGLPYVIENVEGAPLRVDVRLCASGFGLPMRRHRIFELGRGWPMPLAPPCNHHSHTGEADPWRVRKGDKSQGKLDRKKGRFVSPAGNPNREKGTVREWLAAMETPWMDRAGVAQAIPPAYTELLGLALLATLDVARPSGVASV